MTGFPQEPAASEPGGRRHRPARNASDRLSDVAVIELDGIAGLERPAYPRELAVAFGDGRAGAAWLVWPEDDWPSGTDADFGGAGRPGAGSPPRVVVGELAAALAGLRVYAEHPVAVGAWLKRLASSSGAGMPCKVGDLRALVVRPGSKAGSNNVEAVRSASRRAFAQIPVSTRAAADAARHVQFLRFLADPG